MIYPGVSACIDCTLDLFPPQVNFPLCTIAHTPRLPEHCIEYSRILLWPKEKPFGDEVNIDGDDPQHISWIFEKAKERAEQYGIQGVTYRLTQGVVKRIIPAVASTNAVIAAACTTEVFKVVTSCCNPLSNYMVFNDSGACVFCLRVKISCRFKFKMEFTPMFMSKKRTLTALFVVEDHRN